MSKRLDCGCVVDGYVLAPCAMHQKRTISSDGTRTETQDEEMSIPTEGAIARKKWVGKRVRITGGCEDHLGQVGKVKYASHIVRTVVVVVLDNPDPQCDVCSVFTEDVEVIDDLPKAKS